jgi:hypothetical protein
MGGIDLDQGWYRRRIPFKAVIDCIPRMATPTMRNNDVLSSPE